MARAGILLDRDGTVIVDHGYVGSVDRVDLIPGSAQAIAAFNAASIPVAVVSNQAGVARGYYGIDDVEKVHRHLTTLLAKYDAHVDEFLFCPYHPDGTVPTFSRYSFDRKPEPGMAFAAARSLDLDLSASWVIGDRSEDMQLAAAVGAIGIFVGPNAIENEGVWSFPDLATATPFILQRMRGMKTDADRSLAGPRRRKKFPTHPYPEAGSFCRAYAMESARAARSVNSAEVERACQLLANAYTRGAMVFACGNGGSASVANHLQCDHGKGIRNGTDIRPRVVSLSSNIEMLTAIANDYSYEETFVYQLESQARLGDVLIVISSSGESSNIVRALHWAREHDVETIALTGFAGGKARELADVAIHVDSSNYGVVEDNHQAIMHALAQYIRQSAMTPDAVEIDVF